jgi:phosphoenolpyruvate carboxykinase (ATP)
MLEEKIDRYAPEIYLINTGWSAGPIGIGHRIPLRITKRIIDAAFRGELSNCDYHNESYFGLSIPSNIEGVDTSILTPQTTWSSVEDYHQVATALRQRFEDNMEKLRHG